VPGGGIALIGAGAAIGLAVSLLAARVLGQYLLNVSPVDPVAFAGAAAILLAITTLASLAPARRGSRVSPAEAIRDSR
jgi:ABC-type antimicrobial peptide transport system permease subunit